MKKLVSIIIPVYNSESTIIPSLESVRKQTYGIENFQIIVVNDGSTDQSAEIISHYILTHPELNISFINHPNNEGVSSARNAALKSADGAYIALLDSDDEWLPEKIEIQIKYLENSHLKIDFLAVKRIRHHLRYPYIIDENRLAKITFRKLMIRNEAQPSTVVFKRKILQNTGIFDPFQRYAEDLNYWLKISLNNKMFILDEELVLAGGGKRTFGVSGLSANLREMEKGFHKNLKEMLHLKKIGYIEYAFYYVFYRLKYVFRLLRNQYLYLRRK